MKRIDRIYCCQIEDFLWWLGIMEIFWEQEILFPIAIKYMKEGIEKGSLIAMHGYTSMIKKRRGIPVDYF